ncbi:mechanosensitive ion channel family protein, partial [Bacteroides xylanisolvens]
AKRSIRQIPKSLGTHRNRSPEDKDKFNEAGIEIMSPHYMAVRDGNESTIQKGAVKNSGPAKTAEQGDVLEKA